MIDTGQDKPRSAGDQWPTVATEQQSGCVLSRRVPACLEIERQAGQSVPTRLHGGDPLKLLAPRREGHAAWIYTSNYGGGLVSGDELALDMTVQAQAEAVVTSQSATKIYPAGEAGATVQTLNASVGAEGLLVLAPEPMIPFAGARHRQYQQIELAESAGLVLIDGLSAGRIAREEWWAFEVIETRNDVFVDGSWLCRDAWRIMPRDPLADAQFDPGDYSCFMSIVLAGGRIREMAQSIVEQVNARPLRECEGVTTAAGLLARGSGAMIRLAGTRAQAVQARVYELLEGLTAEIGTSLGDRKW
jgi:urease accessory protein